MKSEVTEMPHDDREEVEVYEARIVNESGRDRNATRRRDNRWMSGDENEVQEMTTVRRSGDEWAERKLQLYGGNRVS